MFYTIYSRMSNLKIYKKIFSLKTVAVVGFSPKKDRASNYVSSYMQMNGFNIIPVNPNYSSIDGKKCYKSLTQIKEKIDVVNIFRNSNFAYPIVKEAILINVAAIWMQDGVHSIEAFNLANDKNIMIIMDDCIMRRHIELYK